MALLTDSNAWLTLFVVAEWAIRIVMLVIVPFRRSPDAAKGWLLLILFEPVVGLALYFVFGRRRMPAWRLEAGDRICASSRVPSTRAALEPSRTSPIRRRTRRSRRASASPKSWATCRSSAATRSKCCPTTTGSSTGSSPTSTPRARTSTCSSTSSPTTRSPSRVIAALEACGDARRRLPRPGRRARLARRWIRWHCCRRLRAAGIEACETMRLRLLPAARRAHGLAQSPQDRRDRRPHRLHGLAQSRRSQFQARTHLRGTDGAGDRAGRARVAGGVRRRTGISRPAGAVETGDPFPDPEVTGSVAGAGAAVEPALSRPTTTSASSSRSSTRRASAP